MNISVRLNEEDSKLIKVYAQMHNISLSDLIRNSVLEKIEDEYDLECYQKAIEEAPYLRDPYIESALLYYELQDWEKVITLVQQALKITKKEKTYINEIFSWNETPYDLLSIAYYNTENYILASKYITLARTENPKDKRLQKNQELIHQKLKDVS